MDEVEGTDTGTLANETLGCPTPSTSFQHLGTGVRAGEGCSDRLDPPLQHARASRKRPTAIGADFALEAPHLLALPDTAFDAARLLEARVDTKAREPHPQEDLASALIRDHSSLGR